MTDEVIQTRRNSDAIEAATQRALELAHLAAPLPERVEAVLCRMSPSLGVEMRNLMRQGCRGLTFASPKHWDVDTAEMVFSAVVDAEGALADYCQDVDGLASLVTLEALKIIAERVPDGVWNGVNLHRVFIALRKLHRISYGTTPDDLRKHIKRSAKYKRKAQWHLVRTPDDYIRGGIAAVAFGEIMSAAGMPSRGKDMIRDGVLLAIGAEVSFRAQEYGEARREDVKVGVKNGQMVHEIYVKAKNSKSRTSRIGVVFVPRVQALLDRLTKGKSPGPLFPGANDEKLSSAAIRSSISRTSRLTLGVHATPNLLRRSGASAETTAVAKARRLGQRVGGGRTGLGVTTYTGDIAEQGRNIMKSSLAAYAAR